MAKKQKKMKKFKVWETASGCDVQDPIEAPDRETALEMVLDGMGYSVTEDKEDED